LPTRSGTHDKAKNALRPQTSPGRLDRRKLERFGFEWGSEPAVAAIFEPSGAARMKEGCYANQTIKALS
jgi:hypothetical protein